MRNERDPMTRPERNREHLKAVAQDLGYEWWMAVESVNRIEALRESSDDWANNAALECFLLHARILRDFFRASSDPDDVIAQDFLGSPITVEMSTLQSDTVNKWLNKKVVHLSHSRPSLPRGWNTRHLLEEIDNAMQAFVAAVSTSDREIGSIVAAQRLAVTDNHTEKP